MIFMVVSKPVAFSIAVLLVSVALFTGGYYISNEGREDYTWHQIEACSVNQNGQFEDITKDIFSLTIIKSYDEELLICEFMGKKIIGWSNGNEIYFEHMTNAEKIMFTGYISGNSMFASILEYFITDGSYDATYVKYSIFEKNDNELSNAVLNNLNFKCDNLIAALALSGFIDYAIDLGNFTFTNIYSNVFTAKMTQYIDKESRDMQMIGVFHKILEDGTTLGHCIGPDGRIWYMKIIKDNTVLILKSSALSDTYEYSDEAMSIERDYFSGTPDYDGINVDLKLSDTVWTGKSAYRLYTDGTEERMNLSTDIKFKEQKGDIVLCLFNLGSDSEKYSASIFIDENVGNKICIGILEDSSKNMTIYGNFKDGVCTIYICSPVQSVMYMTVYEFHLTE